MIENKKTEYENTIIVGVVNRDQNEAVVKDYLDELSFLSETAGGVVKKRFIQKLDSPNPKTFIGSGKISEIQIFNKKNDISSVIFDDELSPTQQGNLERILKCKIIDRTGLILDIFAQRAKTSYAKNQVELAQYQYLMPRLKGLWTHLERQKGGIGMRGPGETEIETDRRIVRDKISLLKNKLKNIDKQMSVQRGNRGSLVRVSLVGYTNVGKSTLMNIISKSNVFAEDKLFATLDTTVRKIVIENLPFLITDTVGFIRKLPTQLVESFKSTLNEITESDLILHIVDVSHPNFDDHIDSVNQILEQIKCAEKPSLLVYNKVDKLNEEELENFKFKDNGEINLFISAQNKINIDELKIKLYNEVRKIHIHRFPYNNFLYPDLN
ncbi:MAG: GTPase HflX [Bacteroidota bacterium]|nr:GTPase HflX [Bacteroidota bacterium]MEC7876788.1 GTPase HflX [Bacteroidota bacterium]MEC8367191.1 GTPase HflX [Bacteroidota bacterium]